VFGELPHGAQIRVLRLGGQAAQLQIFHHTLA
jgi:hypothetical protein